MEDMENKTIVIHALNYFITGKEGLLEDYELMHFFPPDSINSIKKDIESAKKARDFIIELNKKSYN